MRTRTHNSKIHPFVIKWGIFVVGKIAKSESLKLEKLIFNWKESIEDFEVGKKSSISIKTFFPTSIF